MSISEAAKYLGVSRSTIYRLIEFDEIRSAKQGKAIRVEKMSLDMFKESGKLTWSLPLNSRTTLWCQFEQRQSDDSVQEKKGTCTTKLSSDARIQAEYEEVLRKPKYTFETEKVAAFLDHIQHLGLTAASSPLQDITISCRPYASQLKPTCFKNASNSAWNCIYAVHE